MSVHDELLARRVDYPVLAHKTYLANHTLGAMHRDTPARLSAYTERWAREGVLAWEEWAPEMVRVADLVGALVGAPPGTTVMRQNVADCLTDVATALPLDRRPRVVLADLEWPGTRYLWSQYAPELEVVTVSDDGVHADLTRLAAAVDDRTAAVFVSQVFFRTATLNDVAPVVEAAHRHGALVVLDAYQAAGAVPLDVVRAGVDVCVGGSVKFLCGGPGAGWMHVADHALDRLAPRTPSWWGHARPFGFEPAWEPAAGVARFAGGTPGVPSAYAAEPGYRALHDIGMAIVRARSLSLTQPLVEAVREHGWTLRSPADPAQRGGSVTFDPGDGERVHDALVERGFVVDHRPGAGIRVGPHFFNTEDEVAALVAAVREISGR
ncbi:MAG TPA: aminotransferase class V-fold PLP-dependent enzyme [Mycobacteriales bacterium]|nr:aminotransferase class V-fold PLP-dependent enzyme [Mycobacteriales bacterium]